MGNNIVLSDELVINKIYLIRGRKVMIDRDLAELYGVETRIINQNVRRNIKRFPEDFMFRMTNEEMNNWKSQIVISNREKMGLRKPPLVFTEQGVAMLSSVLNSEQAIMVNIQIIRIFTKMREIISAHKDILKKLRQLEQHETEQDKQIQLIFQYMKQLEQSKQKEQDFKNRKPIGFRK